MALSGTQITRIAVGGTGLAYVGFAAKAESVSGAPSVPGLEYTMQTNRSHYTMPKSRVHYTIGEED